MPHLGGQHPGMDKAEAGRRASARLLEVRGVPFAELLSRLTDRQETDGVIGASGARYQVEVAGPPGFGPLAVRASMSLFNGSRERLHVATKAYVKGVRKLREADRLLGEGIELPEVIKQLEVSEQTFYRWRNQFGGMKAEDVKRLKELGAKNQRLKRIVADQVLENQVLKDPSRHGNGDRRHCGSRARGGRAAFPLEFRFRELARCGSAAPDAASAESGTGGPTP